MGSVVYIPEHAVLNLADLQTAIWRFVTWGGFRRRLPVGRREEADTKARG